MSIPTIPTRAAISRRLRLKPLLAIGTAAGLLCGCVAAPYPDQPVYAQPAPAQPVYAQPGYAPAQYAQPQYAQPQYAQPQYDSSGYDESEAEGYYAYPTDTPTEVDDGVTYANGVPVLLAGGALMALTFSSAHGGWGYWGHGHHWSPAPGFIGDRLGHRFPGGRGLPPPHGPGAWPGRPSGGGWGGGPRPSPNPGGWHGGPPDGAWAGGPRPGPKPGNWPGGAPASVRPGGIHGGPPMMQPRPGSPPQMQMQHAGPPPGGGRPGGGAQPPQMHAGPPGGGHPGGPPGAPPGGGHHDRPPGQPH